MKILYVLNSGKYGGMEWHVYDLIKGMLKNGHEVFVWCPAGEMSELYRGLGAQVVDEKVRFDIDPWYISGLVNFIKKNSIDIIHAHELKAVTNALLAGFFSKTKVRVSHTHTPISEWGIGKFIKFFTIVGYSTIVNWCSSAEIALTESRKKAKIKEGIQEKKLVVIPNGLDTSKYDISPNQRSDYEKEIKEKYGILTNAFIFGNVSRLTEEKGHALLIKAFDKFLKSDFFHQRDFYLLIAGGGLLEDKLRKLVEDLKLEGKVIITGSFDDSEKVKYYSTFDAFIFPSRSEGFGIVLLEALYMGLPTICSDLEVLKEIGDEVVSFFKTNDADDLAEKMVNEYERIGDSGKVISDAAKMRVEKEYSMEKFVKNYLELYQKLLEENK